MADDREKSFLTDLWEYARDEYIIPKSYEVMHDMLSGITNMASDAVNGTLDKIFYENDEGSYRSKRVSSSKKDTDYSKISTEKAKKTRETTYSTNPKKPYAVKVWVDNRRTAEDIQKEAQRQIKAYNYIRVGDLYSIDKVGLDTSSIDWAFGWTKIEDIKFRPYRLNGQSGYIFDLPTPEKIDNLLG